MDYERKIKTRNSKIKKIVNKKQILKKELNVNITSLYINYTSIRVSHCSVSQ